jgi:hypothetical protein
MTDLERILISTVSYALDFKETALFCRLCGRVSWNPLDVEYRRCAWCNVYHDNVALERHLKKESERT